MLDNSVKAPNSNSFMLYKQSAIAKVYARQLAQGKNKFIMPLLITRIMLISPQVKKVVVKIIQAL